MGTKVIQTPLLIRGGLTGSIYVVTRYTEHQDGRIVALEKFDVTAQYEALQARDGDTMPT